MSKKIVTVSAGSIPELIDSINKAQNIKPDTRKMPEGETWWKRVPLVANLLRFTNFAFKPIAALIKLSDDIKLPQTVGVIHPGIALAIGIFDFLYIPFLAIGGYITDPEAEKGIRGFYSWLRSDRCPVNYTHIGRMAMAALSIAAVSVIIATNFALAPIMLTVISSIIFVGAVSTLVKAIIWNRRYTAELKDGQKTQKEISDEMTLLKAYLEKTNAQERLDFINALRIHEGSENLLKILASMKEEGTTLSPASLNQLGQYVQNQQDRLQALRTRQAYLDKEIARTGMFAVGYKAGMATIAAATVAGFALCLVPGLNFIGIPLIAAAAAVSGAVVIGRAIHLFCTKPEARKDIPSLVLFVATLASIALFAIPGINLLIGAGFLLGFLIAGAARIIYKDWKINKEKNEKEAAKNNNQSELDNKQPTQATELVKSSSRIIYKAHKETEPVNSSSYDEILEHLNSEHPSTPEALHRAIINTAQLLKRNPGSAIELNHYLSHNQQIKNKLQAFQREQEQRAENPIAASDNEPLLPKDDIELVFNAAKLN